MTDRDPTRTREQPGLSADELERQQAADLPDRDALSLIQPGLGLVDLGGNLDPGGGMPSLDLSGPQPVPAVENQTMPVLDRTTP